MEDTLKQDIQKAVEHSGFPLEHYVYGTLKKYGWSVITNRYYIDDIRGTEREIDIVAYQIHLDEIENIQYITTLIISCKQSENKTWCFLTRDVDSSDGNIDWTPLHFCTTDERLEYMTNNYRESIISRYKSNIATRELYSFNENVFAYEQLRPAKDKNEAKQKDSSVVLCGNEDMYNSIITSIKAVGYEKRSRTEQYKQHKYKRYYTFHILSVFEGSMVKDYIDNNGKHNIEPIQYIKYLNRHIVNNKDNFYIVNFVSKNMFENYVQAFNSLHSENSRTLPKLIPSFYEHIFEDEKKVQLIWKNFVDTILWYIKGCLFDFSKNELSEEITLSYTFCKEDNILELCIENPFISSDKIQKLNNHTPLLNYIQKYLVLFFRYKGKFIFTDDGLPF